MAKQTNESSNEKGSKRVDAEGYPLLAQDASHCCGCMACVDVCPKNAITCELRFLGFSYPIIDKKRCVRCRLCLKVCPFWAE